MSKVSHQPGLGRIFTSRPRENDCRHHGGDTGEVCKWIGEFLLRVPIMCYSVHRIYNRDQQFHI